MRFALVCAAILFIHFSHATAADNRPNVVIILADDMGYSDIGCYGGEINTPHLDKLAEGGLRFTQFYNAARCCPTRASLLTGLHPHQAGIGWMTSSPENPGDMDQGEFGYRGFMNRNCVTIAEVLRDAGYSTFMTGKWHIGEATEDLWPLRRGFQRYYGILTGAANYFQPGGKRGLTLDNQRVEPTEDFYLTNALTDHAIEFVDQAAADKPFFLYLAFTSPHWPLQSPPEIVDKYRDTYAKGWAEIRNARYDRMVDMGIIKTEWKITQRHSRPWKNLDAAKQQEMAERMAIYAAQIDRMDENIGRLTAALAEQGKLDNTVLLFLADNGGCAEGNELGGGPGEKLNDSDSPLFSTYGRAWANVSNTPFKRYKHHTHEGGIATPLIVHWPKGIEARGELREQPGYLPDLMATCLELTGASYPTEYHGNPIPPVEGVSLIPAFANKSLEQRAMYWEHEGNRAMRQGDWKLVKRENAEDWELYNLAEDRTETKNLAESNQTQVRGMTEEWEKWAKRAHALPKPNKLPKPKKG
jgi:arylsulfatase